MINQILRLQPLTNAPKLSATIKLTQKKMGVLKAFYLENQFYLAEQPLTAAQMPQALQADFAEGASWSDLMAYLRLRSRELIKASIAEPTTCQLAESIQLSQKIELLVEMIYRQTELSTKANSEKENSASVLRLNIPKMAC